MLKLFLRVTPCWEGALWVCFETAITSILVITPSCPFGGRAMNVLLLLILVEPDGHWAVMADCPPHLSFCLVCPRQYPCVHLPIPCLVSVLTTDSGAPWFGELNPVGLFWTLPLNSPIEAIMEIILSALLSLIFSLLIYCPRCHLLCPPLPIPTVVVLGWASMISKLHPSYSKSS